MIIFIPSFIIIFGLLIFSVLLASFSRSWLSLWFRLELNILIFLPLISFRRKIYELENRIKYFLIQRIASLWFLFRILLFSFKLYVVQVVVLLRIIIKLGVFPFHGWFFRVMSTAAWKFFFLFSTLQKFIPLIVLRNVLFPSIVMVMVISLTLGFILSIGSSFLSARLVLTLSSLNNVRWILLRLQRRTTFWLIYIGLYIVLLVPVIGFLFSLSLPYSGLFFSSNTSVREKLLFSSCVFSLGGLPPFLGFFNKFIMIKLILNQIRLFLVLLIILSSLFLLFYYIRLVFSSLRAYPTRVVNGKPSSTTKMGLALVVSFLLIFFLIYVGT